MQMANAEIGTFSYVQLEEKHLQDLQFLIKTVFKKRFSIDYLKQKYSDQYQCGSLATMAFDGAKPIGFYGAIAQQFSHQNKVILVAHACDSYTLKEYQGKGVHFRLAQLSYELMRKQRIRFVYAFHSENTYHSTKKIGWKEREEMVRFHLKTYAFPMAKVYKRLNLDNIYQKKVNRAFRKFEVTDFCYKGALSHQIMDTAYFEYKNSFFPHYLIKIEQCVFYLKVDAIMQIGFFYSQNREQLDKALITLTKIANKLGVNEILFQCSENSMMFNGLHLHAKPLPSWKIGYLLFDEIDINNFEFTFANLDTF